MRVSYTSPHNSFTPKISVGVDGVCDRLDFSPSLFKNCCVEFTSQSSFRTWVVREFVGRTLFAPTLRAFDSLLELKFPIYRKLSPTQIVGSLVSECMFHRSRKIDKRTLMGEKTDSGIIE